MLDLPERQSTIINAALWKRLLAFLLDILLLDITVFSPFRNIIESAIPKGNIWRINYNFSVVSSITLVSLLALAYFYILERSVGQTAGKMLFGLHVVPTNKNPTGWQFFLRSCFVIPFLPFVLLWVADPLFLLFSKDGQRLTEKFGKTKVVEKIYW